MIETETLNKVDESAEDFSTEAAQLQEAMWEKINYALSLGVFTDSEAKAWQEGFAACDRLEYMENLIDIIDDFIDSGEKVVVELMATLDTDLLTDSEKTEAEWQAEMLCYQDKLDLIKDLKITIKEVAHYRQKLIKILRSAHLPSAKSQEFMQNFAEATADKKEGVVTRAAQMAAELNAVYPTVQSRIVELMSNSQFGEARAFLQNSQLEPGKYAQLIQQIDHSEAQYFRTIAQSA